MQRTYSLVDFIMDGLEISQVELCISISLMQKLIRLLQQLRQLQQQTQFKSFLIITHTSVLRHMSKPSYLVKEDSSFTSHLWFLRPTSQHQQ